MAIIDKLTAIADALRAKTGANEPLTLAQMPDKISGIAPVLQEKNTTENGTVTPDVEYEGLSAVHVDVIPSPGDLVVTMKDGTTVDFSAIAELIADTKTARSITAFGKSFWECANLLPVGYRQLSHITANGSQIIDTGYVLTPNTKIEVDCRPTAEGVIMGIKHNFANSSDDRSFVVQVLPAGGGKFSEWFRRPGYVTAGNFGEVECERAVRKWQGAKYSVDYVDSAYQDKENEKVLSGEYKDWTCDKEHTIHICGDMEYNNETGTSRYQFSGGMILYGCKIIEGDKLERDFVPCINPEGAVGVYDLVTQDFFGSVGTGQFVAGEEVANMPM